MKKLFSLFLLIFISTSVFAYDAGFFVGINNAMEVEGARVKGVAPFTLVNQSTGMYSSFFFVDETKEVGFAFSNIISIFRASSSFVACDRLLVGPTILPFSDNILYNFIPGIILQPEFEMSTNIESLRCLIGIGLDVQLFTNAGNRKTGFGCALNLSSYPIIFGDIKQNGSKSKINFLEYTKFRIGFSIGVSTTPSHSRPNS